MTRASNALVGAMRSLADLTISSTGVGKRLQAAARSRILRARSSTARCALGSRLLSSGLTMLFLFVAFPDELQISDQLLFLLLRKRVFRERGHSAVVLSITARV